MNTSGHEDKILKQVVCLDAAGGSDGEERPVYSVVIPVYNEQDVISTTCQRLKSVMDRLQAPYELIFVNDGSTDHSRSILETLSVEDPTVKVVNFSRNFGHQAAVEAGMDYASGKAVIVIDADLQDPPEIIPRMVEKWKQGYDVVYGKRVARRGETRFKLWTAAAFYRMLRRLTDIEIPVDTGDFRLIDRKVCDVVTRMPEKARFMRGLVAWAGFRQAALEYVREPRLAGETKYPLSRMVRLSMDAVTSFSDKPLKWPLYAGGALAASGVAALLISMWRALAGARSDLLWLCSVILTGNGLVLTGIGIMGQYVSRIYDEVRQRPLYIVESARRLKRTSSHE
ncbi:glycosyltransferase family 2 protein [Kyrpidia spormannii]|uniref:Glycosyltransferase n=1 Tax=Kyrpidia spormannii TaxID=2055160 RepID=A0ACA8Z4X9_9BACL|nr:glycosyltransferase family 2 protein [Kyrpidia spormannii]CAB3389492.1 putative glycosyltransferase [Kyrpidia spormannii]